MFDVSLMAAQITADACKVDCSALPSSAYVDCGPVQPATAVGGKFLGLLKSCIRFVVTLPARCLEWAQSFTLVTFSTMLFLVAAYTMTALSFFGTRSVCLSTSAVWWHFQIYRIFTYAIFHPNLFHVTVNAFFLGSVGKTLEGKLGSYYILNVVLVFGTLCALLQILLELLLSLCYPAILHQCLSGFSGVLFGMLVLALRVTKNKNQSIYGVCHIPKFLYPWLLLVICQVITYEHISIVANVSGIIVGYAYMNDYLNCVKLSPYTIIVLERSELCHWISGLPGFVHYPKNTLIPLTSSVKHARSSSKKLRTKENHVSTTAVKEQQQGGKSELLANTATHNSGTVQSFPNHLQLADTMAKLDGTRADIKPATVL